MRTHTQLKALVEKKDKEIAKAKKIRNEYFDELRRICPHEKTISKSHYYPGGCFDEAYTEYWEECTCCGQMLNEHTET